MVAENFNISLYNVLVHEGGYVNHPKDPGGATNKGVTQAVYTDYLLRTGRPSRSVKEITKEEVAKIYRLQYWNKVMGGDLPSGVDYAVFDYAVNSGPVKASKDLQRVLGVAADGVIGQVTLAAANAASAEKVISDLCDTRMRFLKGLKTWGTFGRGWTSRVEGVRGFALDMAQAGPPPAGSHPLPVPKPSPAPSPAAPPSDESISKTPEGIAGIVASVLAFLQAIVTTAVDIPALQWVLAFGLVVTIVFAAWFFYKRIKDQ